MSAKLNLYYDRAACSLGVRIALEAAGSDYDDTRIAIRKGEAQSKEYLAVNPSGRVPALAIPGEAAALAELAAIFTYLSEQFPDAGLLPQGGMEKARALSLLSMMTTHIHAAGFGPFFRPERFAASEEARKEAQAAGVATVADGFRQLEARLGGANAFLSGATPSATDYIAYVYERWADVTPLKLAADFPLLAAHRARVEALPQTRAALAKENLPPVASAA